MPPDTPDSAAPAEPPREGLVGSARAWISGAALSERAHVLLGLVLPMALTFGFAWRVRAFTVDDAYISFRYAHNLAAGRGLVYNTGERVEGYSNLLWTLLLAALDAAGADIVVASKVLGVLLATASLVPVYLIARRLRPFDNVPCLAPWMVASSFGFTGYAVFGLETSLFLALALTATLLYFHERDREQAGERVRPVSGLLFALATLTRPEAPLLFGLLLASSGASALRGRVSLLRLAAFAAPVLLHLVWRRAYYDAWLPNTLAAKTGALNEQLKSGRDYLFRYVEHAGTFVWLGLGGIGAAVAKLWEEEEVSASVDSAGCRRARETLAMGLFAVVFGAYVVLVGGDWMPFFRFIVPAEPFAFLLVDQVVRSLLARRERPIAFAVVVLLAWTAWHRATTLREAQRTILHTDKPFWDESAGRTAIWLGEHGEPGPVALADIGQVGWETKRPIVDLLGLMAPEVARLPGGYTKKVGDGFTDAIFARDPKYVIVISSSRDCKSPSIPASRAMTSDPRFSAYAMKHVVPLRGGAAWCIYGK